MMYIAKEREKSMRKKWKRVLSVILTAVFTIVLCQIQVSADTYTTDTADTELEIGEYLDYVMVDKLDDTLQFDRAPGRLFWEDGVGYEKSGDWYEYEKDRYNTGFRPLSIYINSDNRISYHGIRIGTEKKKMDKIMKAEGWDPWSSYGSSTEVSYMKYDDVKKSYWEFDADTVNGKVSKWSWLNWRQGDYGEVPFDDIPQYGGVWYYDAVKYVHHNWLMTGLSDTMFGPGESLARAQFATILYRMNEEPQVDYEARFKDVKNGMWYTSPILWAAKEGVVTGYENGNFGPADRITREQMAVMMYRYANAKGYDTEYKADFSRYQDSVYVSSFAQDAMCWAVGNGIITGTDHGTRLNPQGYANRAECATIIMRFCEMYGIS